MKIKFWGTRGSIPTPSTSSFLTTLYGGDTTCVSVEFQEQMIILDAGSGVRLLGLDFLKEQRRHATFFFTHMHWDHIQGFPFFSPAFISGNTFELYGPALPSAPHVIGSILEKTLRGQQEYLTFPIQLNDMPATLKFSDITPGNPVTLTAKSGSRMVVSCAQLNHPGGCLGYRLEEKNPNQPDKIFTFVTDTEHDRFPNPHIQELAKNADVFLYDTQYTDAEYNGDVGFSRVGWGHSTWTHGLKEAQKAGAKKLLLFHHDPMHDDTFLANLEAEAASAGKKIGIEVLAAKQFLEIEI
ncbi:MAG: MBL fold metallo-hydrolase [Verrucomicrobiota bacterium]